MSIACAPVGCLSRCGDQVRPGHGWFDDFVLASVERDAVELSRIRERQALADRLGYVAAPTGQLLNATTAAEKLGVSRPTAENHLRLLEDLFLIVRLLAWGKPPGRSSVLGPSSVTCWGRGLSEASCS
jgi:predicted AAA+ superfamily ATPase